MLQLAQGRQIIGDRLATVSQIATVPEQCSGTCSGTPRKIRRLGDDFRRRCLLLTRNAFDGRREKALHPPKKTHAGSPGPRAPSRLARFAAAGAGLDRARGPGKWLAMRSAAQSAPKGASCNRRDPLQAPSPRQDRSVNQRRNRARKQPMYFEPPVLPTRGAKRVQTNYFAGCRSVPHAIPIPSRKKGVGAGRGLPLWCENSLLLPERPHRSCC